MTHNEEVRLQKLADITMELANRDPPEDCERCRCAFCLKDYSDDADRHAPDCLWRRAKMLCEGKP